jgi:hypothetical protein
MDSPRMTCENLGIIGDRLGLDRPTEKIGGGRI